MKSIYCLFTLALPLTAATSYILPGNAEYGFWNLNHTNYNSTTSPAYPSSGATSTPWGGAIAASSTSATFSRLTGGGYFLSSGSGIYNSSSSGTYGVGDLNPIPNLSNLIFQSRINLTPTSIILNFNGGSQAITPNFTSTTAAGSGGFGPITDFAWQWDLSAFGGAITSYEIVMSVDVNNVIYGNAPAITTISASDSFLQVVPEPSTSLLGIAAFGFTLIRRRRA